MRRALALAKRGGGRVSPNPMVGCVLVKDGRIVGEAYHREFGGPHAEVLALSAAGEDARGSAAYVTLEPCCAHSGKKTPPCAPALAAAGVARVVAADLDPNPAVSGKGLRLLREAGVKTAVGLCAEDAARLNRGFWTRQRLKRPYVILKTALSLDGQAYARGGRSRWITAEPARRLAHKLRARADAVLVGSGTVLADDPALTAHGAGPNPVRVVLDTKLRISRRARLLDGQAPTWIFTASPKEVVGAEIVRVRSVRGRLDLRAVLRELARRGIGVLLVEGGPAVHAAFLKARAVDEAQVFLSPKLVSGDSNPNLAPRLASPRLKKVGQDFLFYGKVQCLRAS